MNLAAIFVVAYLASFKKVAKEGFNATEFVMLRCLSALPVTIIWCICAGYNPIKMFPKKKVNSLILRSLSGHANFFLINFGVSMAPVSLVMVCW